MKLGNLTRIKLDPIDVQLATIKIGACKKELV
jgi:hypothetical protein